MNGNCNIMLIANPIYDTIFKYLMEDSEIAKGLISRILGEKILSLRFTAQEECLEKEYGGISLFRMDFIAQIETAEGQHKKVLIEIQKSKLPSDASRFRIYLGKQYLKKEELKNAAGDIVKASLPIITIYFLGYILSHDLPASLSVKKQYIDTINNEVIDVGHEFIDLLCHDSYVIQIPKLKLSTRTELERMLTVFEQGPFSDEKKHSINYSYEDSGDELVKAMLRKLNRLRVEDAIQSKMDLEDQLYQETQAAISDETRRLTQKLQEERRQKEEAIQKEQEAVRKEQEERRQKEELLAEIEQLKKRLKE